MKEVPYMDSVGLAEIVRAYTSKKKEGAVVVICSLRPKVKELLTFV